MAKFANSVLFTPTLGGTTDWTVSAAVQGFMTPAQAAASDGVYKYRAESADLSQWEVGEGTYTGSGPTLTRTTVLQNSAGTTAKINFSTVPSVGIVALKQEILSIEEANSWTYFQKAWARANMDVLKKNYLLNGAMQVSQQNAANAGTTSGYYPVDQWSVQTSAMGTGTFSAAQVAAVSPAGSPNRLRVTVTAAQATIGSSVAWLQQKIEGFRTSDLLFGNASARTITLQIGIKTAVSGTYTVQLINSASSSSVSGTFTVAGGEINTDVVKTVTIAGPTSGTWTTDNTAGVTLQLLFASTGQANLFTTNGNVLELFDAGLYEGPAAPAFLVPDFLDELHRCQRYWESSYVLGTVPGTATLINSGGHFFQGPTGVITAGDEVFFKVKKRATPTLQTYSPVSGASGKVRDAYNSVDVTPTITNLGDIRFGYWYSQTSANGYVAQAHWTADARM